MTDERRKDHDARRMVEAGAREVLKQFVRDFSPHDVETHDGRMAFRSDLYYVNKLRKQCETFKAHAMKTAIGVGVVGALGALWAGITHWPKS